MGADMQDARPNTGARKMPRSILEKKDSNHHNDEHLKRFQSAMRAMQEGKYDKAKAEFDRLAADGPFEMKDRSIVFARACEKEMQKSSGLEFSCVEERYDYAVLLLNQGNYEDAREHIDAILSACPEADYAYYGAALLASMTGQAEECLQHLGRAIELNPQNRILARRDADFGDMADDPRFTEMLYPEVY
jgi:tetratricopeptide (TPR) repeat protein